MNDSELSARIEALYGNTDWADRTGILHVAAVGGEPVCAIAIGPQAPKSPMDRFVLGFARSRADAILTSGAILRAEPDLVHRYSDSVAESEVLARWRQRVLGKRKPPALLVLSRSGDFPAGHRALAAVDRGFIWTSAEGGKRLDRSSAPGLSIEIPDAEPASMYESVSWAVERARSVLQARTILIEAGPTISSSLYRDPPSGGEADAGAVFCAVDELLLSRFEGSLDAAAVGPEFIAETRLKARFRVPYTVKESVEPSGRWRFERYLARA